MADAGCLVVALAQDLLKRPTSDTEEVMKDISSSLPEYESEDTMDAELQAAPDIVKFHYAKVERILFNNI